MFQSVCLEADFVDLQECNYNQLFVDVVVNAAYVQTPLLPLRPSHLRDTRLEQWCRLECDFTTEGTSLYLVDTKSIQQVPSVYSVKRGERKVELQFRIISVNL